VGRAALPRAAGRRNYEIRYALVGAGCISLLSFLAVPPRSCTPEPSPVSVGLSFLLFGYQLLIAVAVSTGGAVMQAVINCNIVAICLYEFFFAAKRHQQQEPVAGGTSSSGSSGSGSIVLLTAAVSAASSAALLALLKAPAPPPGGR